MISALRKIEGHSALPAPESVQGMFIENHEKGFSSLFVTHPPISKRVEALVRFAGGRDEPVEIVAPAARVDETPSPGPWG